MYGLGIIQEESLSRRKFVRGMIQGNTEDYIPYVQSIRGYGYEKGEFSEIPLKWDDKSKKLTIGERRGSYPGMVAERRFALLLPDGTRRSASYSGTAIEL